MESARSFCTLEKRPLIAWWCRPTFSQICLTDGVLNQNVDYYRNISTENRFGFLSAFRYGNFSPGSDPTADFHYHVIIPVDSDTPNLRNGSHWIILDAGMNAEFVYSIRRLPMWSLCIPFNI